MLALLIWACAPIEPNKYGDGSTDTAPEVADTGSPEDTGSTNPDDTDNPDDTQDTQDTEDTQSQRSQCH